MLKFITNLFAGKKHEAPIAPTPYKVEASVAPTLTPKAEKPTPKAKKPAVKKATTRKPKAAKTPKA